MRYKANVIQGFKAMQNEEIRERKRQFYNEIA